MLDRDSKTMKLVDDALGSRDRRISELKTALRAMIYETTNLSLAEDDGSHKCRITARTLGMARMALHNPDPQ